jgi:hypothetical protein
MAHFARLDQTGTVLEVVVVSNNVLLDDNGDECEELGREFCMGLYGDQNNWVQTSYNGNIRKNFASVGAHYDSAKDAFIQRQPYPSWQLDDNSCEWEPPVPYPEDYFEDRVDTEWGKVDGGVLYRWSEETGAWVRGA